MEGVLKNLACERLLLFRVKLLPRYLKCNELENYTLVSQRRLLFIGKVLANLNIKKPFKFSSSHIKMCRSRKRRTLYKTLVTFCRGDYVLSIGH